MQQNQLPLNDYNHNFLIILTHSNNLPYLSVFTQLSTRPVGSFYPGWSCNCKYTCMYKDKNSLLYIYMRQISLLGHYVELREYFIYKI